MSVVVNIISGISCWWWICWFLLLYPQVVGGSQAENSNILLLFSHLTKAPLFLPFQPLIGFSTQTSWDSVFFVSLIIEIVLCMPNDAMRHKFFYLNVNFCYFCSFLQSTGLDHLGEAIGEDFHSVWTPFQVCLNHALFGRLKPKCPDFKAFFAPFDVDSGFCEHRRRTSNPKSSFYLSLQFSTISSDVILLNELQV